MPIIAAAALTPSSLSVISNAIRLVWPAFKRRPPLSARLPGTFIAREKKLPARTKNNHPIGFGRRPFDFHPRRADWHAGDGKPPDRRPVAQ